VAKSFGGFCLAMALQSTTETGTNLIDENNLPAGKVKHQKFNLIHLKSTTYKQKSTQKSPIFNVLEWLHSETVWSVQLRFFRLASLK
jgi:hypothetical protein